MKSLFKKIIFTIIGASLIVSLSSFSLSNSSDDFAKSEVSSDIDPVSEKEDAEDDDLKLGMLLEPISLPNSFLNVAKFDEKNSLKKFSPSVPTSPPNC